LSLVIVADRTPGAFGSAFDFESVGVEPDDTTDPRSEGGGLTAGAVEIPKPKPAFLLLPGALRLPATETRIGGKSSSFGVVGTSSLAMGRLRSSTLSFWTASEDGDGAVRVVTGVNGLGAPISFRATLFRLKIDGMLTGIGGGGEGGGDASWLEVKVDVRCVVPVAYVVHEKRLTGSSLSDAPATGFLDTSLTPEYGSPAVSCARASSFKGRRGGGAAPPK
jgi:hypothetical protein